MSNEPDLDTPLSKQLADLAKDVMVQQGLGHRVHEIDQLFVSDSKPDLNKKDDTKGMLI